MFVSKPSSTRIHANKQTWNFVISTKQMSLLRADWVPSLRMFLKSQIKPIWGFSLSGWVSALSSHGRIPWNCLTLVLHLRWWFSVWYCNRDLHWRLRNWLWSCWKLPSWGLRNWICNRVWNLSGLFQSCRWNIGTQWWWWSTRYWYWNCHWSRQLLRILFIKGLFRIQMLRLQKEINVDIAQLATNSYKVGQWSQPSYHCTWDPLLHSSPGISHIHRVTWWQFLHLDDSCHVAAAAFLAGPGCDLPCLASQHTHELGARLVFQEQFWWCHSCHWMWSVSVLEQTIGQLMFQRMLLTASFHTFSMFP